LPMSIRNQAIKENNHGIAKKVTRNKTLNKIIMPWLYVIAALVLLNYIL
jgi:hypothetical protein